MNIALLAEICETPGVPGYEQLIRTLVLKQLEGLVDEVSVDNMGNVVAVKKGKEAKKVMVSAHMDEIGFIVTHIDDNGFLKFIPLGGFDPKTLTAQRVIVHGKKDLVGVMGSKPIHIMEPEERTKGAKISDFFIDLGMKAEEVKQIVEVGTTISRERKLIEMGECVNCKSIDNRVSVFILLETLRILKGQEIPYDLYAVFSVQEEVGLRGAQAATIAIAPDFALGLDTTIAYDVPGSQPHEQVTKLGKGAAIKIMDSSAICDYRMVDFLKQTAKNHNITWQPEILPAGGTDTAALQKMSAGGSIAGAISIPTRHIHQVIETASKQDIQDCIDLLIAAVKDFNTYDWKHKSTLN